MGGHRFLGRSLRSLVGTVAAGRLATRLEGGRPDPAAEDHLGSVRGEPRSVRGPRATNLYTEWFPPAAPGGGTIVFTHGLCLTEAVWHYQKRWLSGGPHGIVTWDLPSHGHSDRVAAGELTQEMAIDALARVVDAHADDGGLLLVGHSLGGVVTLGYLARHPESAARLVRGAVLVSTPTMHFARSVAGGWAGAGAEARALGRVIQYLVESKTLDRALHRDVGSDRISISHRVIRVGFGRNASPTQIRFVRDVIASVPPQVRADAFRAMTGYDIRPFLPDIDHPALVVIGEKDRLVNPDESEELAAALPSADALVLPEVGHAAFLEVPRAFNEAVSGFADRHLGSGAETRAGSA